MKNFNIILFSAVIVCIICNVEALFCYTCSYVYNPFIPDYSCIVAPKHQTNCTKKYCTIVRQEIVSPAGKVNSFQRSCEDKPLFLDDVKADATFKTFYRSCTRDLCNDWNGIRSIANSIPESGAIQNMIIKGKPN